MDATESLRNGDLATTMAILKEEVMSNPSSIEPRIFLFQLLSVQGEWDRAMTQLTMTGELDAGALAMVQTYRETLQCEKLREEILRGKVTPLIFGEPSDWLALLIEALRFHGLGEIEQGGAIREEAFEQAPSVSGSITLADDGVRSDFQWIADADTRYGPCLELIVNGRLYFAPFERIKKITIEAPADLRDMVWLPAQFCWSTGGETVGFIPTRYAGSQGVGDDALALARKTEWREVGEGIFEGLGQRLLATDRGEFPLMDIRQIVLDVGHYHSDGESCSGGGA